MKWVLGLIFSLIEQASSPAQPSGTPWWQVITGILAIPASIIGLLGAYQLSQKTRFETRKLQLEILEKEGNVVTSTKATLPREELVTSPHALAAGTQDFFIRFVILYLTGYLWGLIVGFIVYPFWAVINIARDYGLSYTSHQLLALASNWLISIGNLVVFLTLGLPLLKDIMSFLGLRPKDLFKFQREKQ